MSEHRNPYETSEVDLQKLQDLAMNEARAVLENAGLKVDRMAMVISFSSDDVPQANMAAFFPMDEWEAHVELMRETTMVCEAASKEVAEKVEEAERDGRLG